MSSLNLNIADDQLDSLTGPEIKAHIAAISGQPEKKIARKQDGLTTLRRLRMWALNEDGLCGVRKDSPAMVRSYAELQERAAAKGRTLADLPKAHEKITPIDPEWDDEADIVDGNDAITEAQERAAAPVATVAQIIEAATVAATPAVNANEVVIENASPDAQPWPFPNGERVTPDAPEAIPHEDDADEDDSDAPAPTIPAQPETKTTAAGVTVEVEGETITHRRGTLRARLAQAAAAAAPIVPAASAKRERKPKKLTGEPRKVREALIAVKATFRGLTKCHAGGMRANVKAFIESKATRDLPGWPVGTVLPAEIDAHFMQDCKAFLHKLIEDNHAERVVPIVPGVMVAAPKPVAQQEAATV